MHKRRLNEFTLSFAIRPQGPLLIKSGQESGADPTLLDMNFVRTHHAAIGDRTVYLPGSSLKGTLRSYAEKIARTLSEGQQPKEPPPFCCNPLGNSNKLGAADYFCGSFLEKRSATEKHALACPICRTFGHTSQASHVRLSDAYPLNPNKPDDRAIWEQANQTDERDGVAIDRVSGAVAVGPFNLEVVTQGAFYGSLTLHNFQLWQIGLLAIVLRDLSQGRVPIGFAKSRGLGRVSVEYLRAEIAYPGRFSLQSHGYDFGAHVYGVNTFLSAEVAEAYGYQQEELLPLPAGDTDGEKGDFGRVSSVWQGEEAITNLWRACVPYWQNFVTSWPGREAVHE
jgi:CRISPR/Cas system CSM-associated protein Csm3 (group 7 of RAMP superfamily)